MANTNVVLDLETTGVSAGCCILSIGAVIIVEEKIHECFYETISHQASRACGFVDDPSTIAWWNKQVSNVQEEAFSGIATPAHVLNNLSERLKSFGSPREIHMWGNGADFDNVILAAAYKKLDLQQPWHYTNNSCYRTWKNSVPIPVHKSKLAHHALEDAMAEALHLIQIHKFVQHASAGAIKVLR